MLSIVFYYFLLLLVWSTACLWLAAIIWTGRELKELKPLRVKEFSEIKDEPLVSILFPARNEEKRILAEALNSLLAQTFKNLEIIAVNDRSTDKTGEILRRIARGNPKLRTIEGSELPADWLGKPFVLEQALAQAGGEWVISVDADVIFAPEAVKAAVFYAAQNNYDALCLIPFDVCGSVWETIFLPTFGWFRMLKMPASRVNNPKRPETMGVGNFFLVRRACLKKIGNFESVKNEVAEDLRLAELLKSSGASFRLDYAPDLLKTRMYKGFGEIWAGFTKNLFAGTNFSPLNAFWGAGSILLFGVLPVILAAFCLAEWIFTRNIYFFWLSVPAVLIYICQITVFATVHVSWKKPLSYALAAPVGMLLFAAILINSAIRILTGRGVVWKERAIYRNRGRKLPPQILENK